jgi:hypothetical protein
MSSIKMPINYKKIEKKLKRILAKETPESLEKIFAEIRREEQEHTHVLTGKEMWHFNTNSIIKNPMYR